MLSYVFVLSVHAAETLRWRRSSLIPPIYQPVTPSNVIYQHLSVGIITTDRSEPSVDWRIRCCRCNYTSNCATTEELTGVLYYKTLIVLFFFCFSSLIGGYIYCKKKEREETQIKISFPRVYERKCSRIPILLGRLM